MSLHIFLIDIFNLNNDYQKEICGKFEEKEKKVKNFHYKRAIIMWQQVTAVK